MQQITLETVSAAAEALAADGQNPTQAAIRKALGGGSYSTIGPLLNQWRENHGEAAELAAVELPEALAAAGTEMLARVWKTAMAEAQAGHEALRKELLASQAETTAAREETTEIAASLEADLDARDKQIASLNAANEQRAVEFDALNQRALSAEKQVAILSERAEGHKARADRAELQLSAAEDATKAAQTELVTLRERLDAASVIINERTSDVTKLRADLDHANSNLQRTEADLKSAQARIEKIEASSQARIDKLEADAEALRTKNDAAMSDLGAARADLATARAERTQADERAKRAEAALTEAQNELKSLKKPKPQAATAGQTTEVKG